MTKSALTGFLKLLRLPYWLMTGGLAVITLAALKQGNIDFKIFMLTFFSMAFLSSAGFSINDYFDRESDAIIKPKRPIPSREITPNFAVATAIILFIASLFLSYLVNLLCFFIVLVDSILLAFYSAYVKHKSGLASNILVGCLTGTAFLYGETAGFGAVTLRSLSIYPVCFGTIGGNILRDVLSLEGDSKVGYPTLPKEIGVEKSVRVAVGFFVVSALLAPTPYLLNVFGEGYLICILIWSFLVLFSSANLLMSHLTTNVKKNERLMTMGMTLLILALMIEAFL